MDTHYGNTIPVGMRAEIRRSHARVNRRGQNGSCTTRWAVRWVAIRLTM